MMLEKYKIKKCSALGPYKLNLTFEDGKKGVVDLNHLVGKGVFALWNDPKEFEKVTIDPVSKTVCWGAIDLDPVTLRDACEALRS